MELLGINIEIILLIIPIVLGLVELRRNTKLRLADFLVRKFEGFQRDRQAMLDNPRILTLLAEEKGIPKDDYLMRSINTFRIYTAFENYYLHKKGHIEGELWERDKKDIYRLFTNESILERWEEVKQVHSTDFQAFIEEIIQHKVKTTRKDQTDES